MKRKIIETVVVLLCLSVGFCFYAYLYEEKSMKDLALENIDALATPEGYPSENFCCYGQGDIDCHGVKVEMKFQRF